MEDKTQEWLHRTRQLDRKHAIRGGVQRDLGAIKQTSAVLVGALAVMGVLIIAPLRLSESPAPRIRPGPESRVQIDPKTPAGQALHVVRAVLPADILPPTTQTSNIPSVPPAVSIWNSPRISGGISLQSPSRLPEPAMPESRESNLLTR
jgi:hypothetical protein